MLNDRQWERYEKILYNVRDFSKNEERLLFTSQSLVDLQLYLTEPLLRLNEDTAVLENWEKTLDAFVEQLYDEAVRQNGVTSINGQMFRIVSEDVAHAAKGWIDENCPRGVD